MEITSQEIDKIVASSSDYIGSNDDQVLFRTVFYLAKEEMPSDKLNSLLYLQQLNGVNISYKNLSWDTVTEIQKCLSTVIMKNIVSEIKKSSVYALMIDETTDLSVQKKLSICVRYVVNGESVTKFLANVKLIQGTAHAIVTALILKLEELGLDPSKLVSFATDGAATMMGRKTGVGVQMKAKYSPFMIQSHCIAHRLNLACNDSIKKIKPLQVMREKFASLYFFMSGSSNRVEKLKQMQTILNDPSISIKEPHSIRWLGLYNAVKAVYECYPSLLATLSALAAEKNAVAKGLHKYFALYKTALIVAFMVDVHAVIANLSLYFQKQNMMFSAIKPSIDGTIGELENLKKSDGECLTKIKADCEKVEGGVYFKGEKLIGSSSVETEFKSLSDSYINNLIQNIKSRLHKDDAELFRDLSLLLEPFSVLEATEKQSDDALLSVSMLYGDEKHTRLVHGNMEDNNIVNEDKIVEPLLDGEQLKKEWPKLRGMIEGSYKNVSTPALCKRIIILHDTDFPSFSMLCKIALCMQLTSVECERSFSCQNRLKTKFRASLTPERLETLMNISWGPPLSDMMDVVNPAICLWHKTPRRTKRLYEDYKPRKSKKLKA